MSIINLDPSSVKYNLKSLFEETKRDEKLGRHVQKNNRHFRFTTESSLEGLMKNQNSSTDKENTRKSKMKETQSENWLG